MDTYGPWLFQKNIVVKINSVVFAHGGLNEKYSKMKIGELNKAYRRELEMLTDQRLNRRRLPASFRPRMVYQPDSPLWYRDLADTNGRMAMKTVSRILDNLGASSMVVGHTIASNGGRSPIISQDSMNRFEGRIWTIDTGISSYYGGASSAWVYNGGEITIWPADQVELPERSAILAEADSLMNPQETELYLKTAPVLRIKKSEVVGRTDPWTITLDDGKTVRRGVFKYINRRRQADTLLADSFKYEVAAYALSRHLGLEIVPPVVEREIDGIPGSLQIFVENAITETDRRAKKIEPPDPETFLTATQVARVFENLVANACDDTDDTFVQDGTWKIFRIDFSEAFRAEPKLMPGCEFTRITRSLYEKLRGWDDQKIFDLMAPYLNPDETKALNTRRILILQRIDRLIREKGEKAVLFD